MKERRALYYCKEIEINHTSFASHFRMRDTETSSTIKTTKATTHGDDDAVKRGYRRREVDYTHLWPIALAPAIPALGLALRSHPDPRVRVGLPAAAAFGVLFFAHGFALKSVDTK
jgi:hypothetical protein